jgi:hypothetical protein
VILKPFLLAKTEGGRAWKCIGNFKKKDWKLYCYFQSFFRTLLSYSIMKLLTEFDIYRRYKNGLY